MLVQKNNVRQEESEREGMREDSKCQTVRERREREQR